MRKKDKQPQLETKNLILYPLLPEQMLLLQNDPNELCRSFSLVADDYAKYGEWAKLGKEQYEKMMADPEYMSFHTLWIITEKEGKHLVGYLYFLDRPSDTEAVELNGFIKPAYRRRGYMTEALNTLRGWAFANKDVTIMLARPAKGDEIFHGLLRKSGFGHWVEHEHNKDSDTEIWCCDAKPRTLVKVGLLLGLGLGVIAGSVFSISRWITALIGAILGIAVCAVFDVKESRKRYALLKAEQDKV